MDKWLLLAVVVLFGVQLLSSIQERRWLVKAVIARNTAELAAVDTPQVKFVRSDIAREQDDFPLGL